jgi:hypothetical protein
MRPLRCGARHGYRSVTKAIDEIHCFRQLSYDCPRHDDVAADGGDDRWNPTIAPGATLSGIGFNASYSGSNPSPTTFYINGTLCRAASRPAR